MIFRPYNTSPAKSRKVKSNTQFVSVKPDNKEITSDIDSKFPPQPPSRQLMHQIITGFCNEFIPENFIEAGCKVCGQLKVLKDMKRSSECNVSLDILVNQDCTRQVRQSSHDPCIGFSTPVLATGCEYICISCLHSLSNRTIPNMALSNGL